MKRRPLRRVLRKSSQSRSRRTGRRMWCESLEPRQLLAVTVTGLPEWNDLGARPLVSAGSVTDPDNQASGAVEAIAVSPVDRSVIFIGSANGGIWKTTNGDRPYNGIDDDGINGVDDAGEHPDWVPLTDDYPSLAIGDLRFDPADPTGQTVFAGTGSASSLGRRGGSAIGVMKSTDGGDTWTVYPLAANSPRVRAILPTTIDGDPATPGLQQVVLAGTFSANQGLYRSVDGGETYTNISGINGLPTGQVTDLLIDPNNSGRIFAGVVGQGVYRSDDGGQNWTAVNTGLTGTSASTLIQLTAHPNAGTTRLYTLVSGASPAAFRSDDGGTTWTALATIPAGFQSDNNGLYTGMAADQLIVDPSNPDIVYIAKGYGNSPAVYRYDPSGSGDWILIDSSGAGGNTRPHVDFRDMQFTRDEGGTDVLLVSSDGGIYYMENPQDAANQRWRGLHGRGVNGLGIMEFTNIAWDSNFDVVVAGAQDNGTSAQNAFLDPVWTEFRNSDGGDVQVDAVSVGGNSLRYSSTQGKSDGTFTLRRHEFDSATNDLGAIQLIPSDKLPNFVPYFVPAFELNQVDPQRLVVGGKGSAPVYELLNAASTPDAASANWVAVPVGAGFTTVNDTQGSSFAVGGRKNGTDNPDVLVVGSGSGVFVRSTSGGTLTATPTPFPGGTVQDIVLDPENWEHFFVSDGAAVYETLDAGTSWTNLTAGFPGSYNQTIRSLEFVPTGGGGTIVAGGNLGVSRLDLGDLNPTWRRLGAGVPNAQVWDLDYSADDDVLVAGTFGRGAFLLQAASLVANDIPVINVCGDDDYANQDDTIRITRNGLNPLLVDIFLNNPGPTPDLQMPLAIFQQINVFGVGGNDQLIIDVTNGLIDLPGGIRFDGDGSCNGEDPFGYDRGFDTLIVTQSNDTNWNRETIAVGPTAGSGRHEIVEIGGDSQTIYFEELEPILTDVVANLDVTAIAGLASLLQEANDVAVTDGTLLPAAGRVEIDQYEPIEFKRKDQVSLDTGAGNDRIVVDLRHQPEDLTQLTLTAGLGNDDITTLSLPNGATTSFATLLVYGNEGDDRIDGAAVSVQTRQDLQGGPGRDVLIGGAGDDRLNGGAGDDLLQAGDPAVQTAGLGDDSVFGGEGVDTLLVVGTGTADSLLIDQTNAGTLSATINGSTSLLAVTDLERVDIDGRGSSDLLTLTVNDALFGGAADPASDVLAYTVIGDGAAGSDRLQIVDDGLGDTIIWRQNPDGLSGSIAMAPGHSVSAAPPIEYRGVSRVDVTPLDPISGGTGADGEGRLFVFKPDPFEANDSRLNARHLGAGATTNVDPTIDPAGVAGGFPADQDWYRFVAAETGVLDVQTYYTTVATLGNGRSGLPGSGQLTLEVRDAAGNLIGSTSPAGGNARLAVPVVRNQVYYVRLLGATNDAANVYNLSVINVPAPVPQVVDLQAASDSGRSDNDNVTNDTTATFDIFLDDDRLEEFTNIDLVPDTDFFIDVFNNGELIGTATFAGPAPGNPANGSRWEFTATPGDLLEGHNNFISAAVRIRDRATPNVEGRGSLSTPLQVTLDTVAPAAPTIGIDPATTDSGVAGRPPTMADHITNVTAPGFLGTAEADAIVRLFAQGTAVGETVAVPLDGDEAFAAGQWNQTPTLDLNADGVFPFDGYRQIEATAEDLAGNVSPPGSLDVMIDTQGPRVAAVYTPADPTYNLFGLKPDTNRPTPLINSLAIDVIDFPARNNVDPGFLNYPAVFEAVAESPGHYRLVGDHNGIIDIESVDFVANAPANGAPATGTITLTFARPLPDDRFTLTVSDTLVDPVGNRLDGESSAAEPQIAPAFPSGDGQPGGDFVARFTVDTRAELGTFAAGSVYIDTNGNFVFDPEGKDRDDTNEDITYVLGYTSDDLFAGNFALAGDVADGFDKLAAYGRVGGAWRWLIDTDNDGVPNVVTTDPTGANGLPVAGEFDGNTVNGDEVGVYTGSTWYFDTDHDFLLDTTLSSNLIGYPVVGDFDGDGTDDLGAWTDDTFMLDLSFADGVIDGQADRTFTFGFIGVRELPVAADMDGDGVDDLGLWVPDRSGAAPDESGEWYFLISGGQSIENRIVADPLGGFVVNFTPVPFGNDLFAQFGDDFALPIVGNFDPPVVARDPASFEFLRFQNPRDPYDVNDDGFSTPQDALFVINALTDGGARSFPTIRSQVELTDPPYLDVTGDYLLSPADALSVITAILSGSPAEGESTPTTHDASTDAGGDRDRDWLLAVDEALAEWGQDEAEICGP